MATSNLPVPTLSPVSDEKNLLAPLSEAAGGAAGDAGSCCGGGCCSTN